MSDSIAKRTNGNPSASFGSVVDNIFQNSLRRFFDDNYFDSDHPAMMRRVPVNVRETEQQFEIDVIAPGCKKEDFKIKMDDNVLTVSFEHKEEKKQGDEKGRWERNEYVQQSFSRSFTLDDTVDVDKINATYTDGILRLTLAKNEKAKKVSRNIMVK